MSEITLSKIFIEIRNYLAGREIGITRDRSLLSEVTKCLFCKMHILSDEFDTDKEKIALRYRTAFGQIKKKLNFIFSETDELLLDPESIVFIDNQFSKVNLVDYHNDPLSELYQTFIGSEARGNEGQFFTPTEAVKLLIEIIKPKENEKIIDPACGAGSFLSYSARYLKSNNVTNQKISKNLFGIEKDEYLANLAQTHLALATLGIANIVSADSIERKNKNGEKIQFELDEKFDIVLANPPFGTKIKIGTDEAKKNFDLAYNWKLNKETQKYEKTDKIIVNPSPQILFLELCIKLLKPNGRMGIVIPESLLSSSGSSYVVQYLLENMELNAVIGMPENLFKTSGKGGTHTKTCLVVATKSTKSNNNKIFMAEAKWCGHDSRGNIIPNNDLPIIGQNYLNLTNNDRLELGYYIDRNDIINYILAPRYYSPFSKRILEDLKHTHDLISIDELIQDGILEIRTGDEIGKLAYGTGDIPFIRTSDISNWEIKLDPKHGVSLDIYESFCHKQDVQEGDILMVKDGTYLIGTCAFVSKYDTKILYQSHLYKIRVLDKTKISPFLLLAALSSQPVINQIQAKRFTQDIIDSLGKRITELILPFPKDKIIREKIESMVKQSINDRIESRELSREAKHEIINIFSDK